MSRLKKSSRPSDEQNYAPIPQETAHYTTKTGIRKAVRIIPRNIHQESYLEALLDDSKIVVIANGPAGCGKTYLGMLAGIKMFSEKSVSKIILCRPNIGVDDNDIGFLPGDVTDKMYVWVRPMLDVLFEYYSKKDIENMIDVGTLEFAPLMHMRGRNIKNTFVILDESQNASISECKSILTRLCEGSKLIMTGDNDQSDRKNFENGLLFLQNSLEKFGGSKYIDCINFDFKDIERHPVVKDVLEIFKQSGK